MPDESAEARSAKGDLARRHLSIAEMLVAAGADLNQRHMSNTAVHVAAGIGNRRLMTSLLRAGASTSSTAIAANGVIGTALSRAALYCRPLAARLLLHAGALETARDGNGFLPIEVVGSLALDLPSTPHEELERRSVAVKHALLRGPAFRAEAWLWPVAGAGTGTGSATKAPSRAAAARGRGTKGKGIKSIPPEVAPAVEGSAGSAALATVTAKATAVTERRGGSLTKEEEDEKVGTFMAAVWAGLLVRQRFVAQPRYGERGGDGTRVSLSAMLR